MDDEGDEYLVCDWCGHECQDFTSFLGTSMVTSVPMKTKPTEGDSR